MSLSFALSPEQRQLRDVVRQFATEVVDPAAASYNADQRFPEEIVRSMGEMGLFGLPFAEEHGGTDGDLLSLCLAIEELGRVDQSIGLTLAAAVTLGAAPLAAYGTDEQRRRWLPELCRGERLAALGLTEPGGGSDVRGATRTRARRSGDDWIITGSKAFVTNAGTALTSIVTITALTGERELTSILVPIDTPGLTLGPAYRKVGWHGSDTRELILQDVRVPVAFTLGQRGAGLRQLLACLVDGRIAIAALAVGMIQGCVDECVRYANEREAFGSTIAARQAIAFKIVDMEVAARTARQAYYLAAWRRQEGLPCERDAAIAKLYASEQAVSAARQASQIFGGYGFMTDYRVGRFYQDAKVLEIGEGTSEVQRMLIAEELGLG